MVGWHHQLNGHELGQTSGDSEGQEGLVCCSPWGHKELDTTARLNSNNNFGLKTRRRTQDLKRTLKHGGGQWAGLLCNTEQRMFYFLLSQSRNTISHVYT